LPEQPIELDSLKTRLKADTTSRVRFVRKKPPKLRGDFQGSHQPETSGSTISFTIRAPFRAIARKMCLLLQMEPIQIPRDTPQRKRRFSIQEGELPATRHRFHDRKHRFNFAFTSG